MTPYYFTITLPFYLQCKPSTTYNHAYVFSLLFIISFTHLAHPNLFTENRKRSEERSRWCNSNCEEGPRDSSWRLISWCKCQFPRNRNPEYFTLVSVETQTSRSCCERQMNDYVKMSFPLLNKYLLSFLFPILITTSTPATTITVSCSTKKYPFPNSFLVLFCLCINIDQGNITIKEVYFLSCIVCILTSIRATLQ